MQAMGHAYVGVVEMISSEGPAVIRSVRLENFRSYEDQTIIFESNEAVIYGDNGAGKSNVGKAIEMACLNLDIPPEENIRHGATELKITLTFADGRVLKRTRKKSEQFIYFYDRDGNEIYKTDKPSKAHAEVEKFTGFRTYSFDQKSKPFNFHFIRPDSDSLYLDKSAERVLRILSVILRGQGVETTKLSISDALRKLKGDQRVVEKLLTMHTRKEAIFETQPWQEHVDAFNKLEEQEKRLKKYDREIRMLEEVRDDFAKLDALDSAVDLFRNLNFADVEQGLSELETIDDDIELLRKSRNKIDRYRKDIELLLDYEREYVQDKEQIENQLGKFKCNMCGRVVQVLAEVCK